MEGLLMYNSFEIVNTKKFEFCGLKEEDESSENEIT